MESPMGTTDLFGHNDFTVKLEEPLSLPSFGHSLQLPQNSFGGYSPASSDYGGYNSSIDFSSPSSTSVHPSTSPSCFLSSATDTLNNYGATAYSLDSYGNSFSPLDTTHNTTIEDSPPYQPIHITPASTPAPSEELPAEEQSYQLIESLSLQPNPSFNNSCMNPDNMFQHNTSFSSYSASSSPQNLPQTSYPTNYNNLQQSFSSQYTPQFQQGLSLPHLQLDANNLDSINEADLLNIPGGCNIDQIISNEGLANEENGPSSLGSSPSVPNGQY